MFLEEIILLLEKKISPKKFNLNTNINRIHYGQSHNNKLIRKVMITIDLSFEAIKYAIKNKINLIISYYGLIDKPIQCFSQILINKLTLLSKYPITIYLLDSSFIATEGGISDIIMEALYLKLDKTFNIKNNKGYKIPLGRICLSEAYPGQNTPLTLKDLINRIKTNFKMEMCSYVGNLNQAIRKICIVGGNYINSRFLEKALKFGCECYISGKINYEVTTFARDMDLNLIMIPHFKQIVKAMRRLCNIMCLEFPRVEFLFFNSKDPIQIN